MAYQKNNLLINRIIEGDQIAFKAFFEQYYPLLIEFSRYFVKSNQNAEEVVTDVFVKVWYNREKLLEIKDLKAYLFTLTKRESLNYIRNNKLNNKLFVQLDDQLKITVVNPEYEYLYAEILEVLNNAINDLPEKCRLVFQMVKEKGMKYKEVAALLEISEKAVEMHVSKALHRIKQALAEYQNASCISSNAVKKVISIILVYLIMC